MKLLSLKIENFRVIKKADFLVPDRVVGIIGPNGSGKSSIVEAIAWALYGNRVARSGKDEIKSDRAGPAENCEVQLGFELDSDEYTVLRRLVGRRERPEVELYRNGKVESIGSTETDRHLVALLGLDWRGFLTSFLARQQELNALADYAPAQRREHLAGMLGIGRLDKAVQRVKIDRKLLSERAMILRKQTEHGDELSLRIKNLTGQERILKNRLVELKGALKLSDDAFGKVEAELKEGQAKESKCSVIKAKIEATQLSLTMAANQIAQLQSQAAQLSAAAAELASLEPGLGRLAEVKASLEALKMAKHRAAHRTDLTGQIKAADSQSEMFEQRIREQEAAVNTAQDLHGQIPGDIETQLKTAEADLENARQAWSEAQAEVKTSGREVAKLKSQIESIGQIGPETVCDRCHRPFGDDLEAIKLHLESELSTMVATDESSQKQLSEARQKGEETKSNAQQLKQEAERRRDLANKLENLRKDLTALKAQQTETRERGDQLKQALAELGAVEFDQGALDSVSAEFEQLTATAARAQQLKGQIAGRSQIEQNLKSAADQQHRLKSDSAEMEREHSEINFDETVFLRTKAEFARLQEQVEGDRTASLECSKELEITKSELKSAGEQLLRLAKTAEELEETQTDQLYAEKLAGLFGEFRKYTISRIRPRLAELATELMTEMSGNKYNLVELDEDYNLRIMDYGQYYGIERYSGGEKDLASLCLRLAISGALTEAAGLDRSFVILDEVFGSQDDSRRELIFKSLVNLRSRFPQMILITHLEELKNKVETLIELHPHPGGWSEVRVNGEVA